LGDTKGVTSVSSFSQKQYLWMKGKRSSRHVSNGMKYIHTIVTAPLLSIFSALPAYAQGSLKDAGKNLGIVSTKAGTSESDIGSVVGIVINAALTLVGLIFLALMVYAGYLWMTARGESEPVDKAKKIIAGSLIGLVIVLSAYAITVFVTTGFTR